MDLSFSRLSPIADPIAPPRDAATVLAALSAYRCAAQSVDRHLFAPADGAFNSYVALLLQAVASYADRPSGGGAD